MYLPGKFAETDLKELDALVAAYPFATLVTVQDGLPFVSHLPVLYARDGERVVFRGLLGARQSAMAPRRRVIADRARARRVCVAVVVPGQRGERAGTDLGLCSRTHRRIARDLSTTPSRWPRSSRNSANGMKPQSDRTGASRLDRADHRVQLKGIVGFRLAAARIELKFKLNQNHPLANRSSVVSALLAQGDERALAVAETHAVAAIATRYCA